MSYQYLMIDSRSNPVAKVRSDDGPNQPVWKLQVNPGDIKRILVHEYVSLVGTSERFPAMEGTIVRREGDCVWVARVRELSEEVRRNLRIPVRFESFLYPVSGTWRGRVPVLSNDLSWGGVSFFCARPLQEQEVVQIVIPVTSQPLLLNLRILRQRPSGEPIPLYAGKFLDLVHEEERMVREAVFSLQFQYQADQ